MRIAVFLLFVVSSVSSFGQVKPLSNADVVDMAKAGLGDAIVIEKINSSICNFDVSAKALIELKKAEISDEVIKLVISRMRQIQENSIKEGVEAQIIREREASASKKRAVLAEDALETAKTISISKDSLNPSLEALEKELLKRKEWPGLNLTIVRGGSAADLKVDISFVRLSVITHRYVFRIYDTRSNTVIAAGETTSWGSLAENLARNIAKSLIKVKKG